MAVSDFPCRDCGKIWPHAEKYWHCTVCHETYVGERAWDNHQNWKLCAHLAGLEALSDTVGAGNLGLYPEVWGNSLRKTKYRLVHVEDERGFTNWQYVNAADLL